MTWNTETPTANTPVLLKVEFKLNDLVDPTFVYTVGYYDGSNSYIQSLGNSLICSSTAHGGVIQIVGWQDISSFIAGS